MNPFVTLCPDAPRDPLQHALERERQWVSPVSPEEQALRSRRVAWMGQAAEELRPHFAARGLAYPADMSFGIKNFTEYGRPHCFGECSNLEVAALDERTTHPLQLLRVIQRRPQSVRISLAHNQHWTYNAGATLIHELTHSCLPWIEEHGPAFEMFARSFGLEGNISCTYGGLPTYQMLQRVAERIGPYPDPLERENAGLRSPELHNGNPYDDELHPEPPEELGQAFKLELLPFNLEKW